jgi:hypothetical protein
MNSMKNVRFDSERDADKNLASENGWGTHGPPAWNSFEAGPDTAQVIHRERVPCNTRSFCRYLFWSRPGTVKGSSMGITIPAKVNSAGSDNFSFSFTYTVNDGDTWTSNVTGVETGTIKTGPRAGQTFTIAHSPMSTGMFSRNGSTLTLATLDPTVEIVTFSNGDVHKRICHRSRVFIKLRNND